MQLRDHHAAVCVLTHDSVSSALQDSMCMDSQSPRQITFHSKVCQSILTVDMGSGGVTK